MTAYPIKSPFFALVNAQGLPVTNGQIYIGVAGSDPESEPQAVYWDDAGTIIADQPLQVRAGYVVNAGSPASVYTAPTYSIRAYDALGVVIFYQAMVEDQNAAFIAGLPDAGGAAQIGADDGASGDIFTTIQGFIAKLQSQSGAGLPGFSHAMTYSRPSIGAKLRTMVNPYDYPFNCTGDGSADDTARFQQAMDFVANSPISRSLYIPEGKFLLTSKVGAIKPIRIIGEGWTPYTGNNGQPGTAGDGSWLLFAHNDTGMNFGDGTIISGVEIENIGFQRPNQPVPTTTAWAPIDTGYDIAFNSVDCTMDKLMFLGTARGVRSYNGNYGRVTANNIFGHFFIEGMNLDKQYDLPIINNFRSWVYWADNDLVKAYTRENLAALALYRVDNPQVSNFFSIAAKASISINQSADSGSYPGGTVSKGKFTNIDCDIGKYGIYIDAGVTNTCDLDFANMSIQGFEGEASSVGIYNAGSNSRIGLANVDLRNFQQNAIRCVTGTGNRVDASGRIMVDGFNNAGAAFPAFEFAAGNEMHLWSVPSISGGAAGAATYGGGGTFTIPSTVTP